MSLIRWSPRTELWDPFSNLVDIQEEMDRWLDPSLRLRGRSGFEGMFAPAMDIVAEKDHFLVRAELPGLSKDEVSVSMDDKYLTIKGEKKHETETKEASFYRRERMFGSFSRTFELPVTVDPKKIEAHFKDGVLHVRLPKTEEAKPKQIEVKVN